MNIPVGWFTNTCYKRVQFKLAHTSADTTLRSKELKTMGYFYEDLNNQNITEVNY